MTEERGIISMPLDDMKSLGQVFHESGMFPDIKTAAQAIVKIAAGRELGLPPVYSMTHIFMVQGRVTVGATIIATKIKQSGRYDYRVKEHTESHCVLTFFDNGKPVYDSAFSLEDAKRANLVKPDSAWVKTPRAMLFARAVSQGARVVCPEVLAGVYAIEEFVEGEAIILPEMPTEEAKAPESPSEKKAMPPQEGTVQPPPKGRPKPDMTWDRFWVEALQIVGVSGEEGRKKVHAAIAESSMQDWLAKGGTLAEALKMLRALYLDQKPTEEGETP